MQLATDLLQLQCSSLNAQHRVALPVARWLRKLTALLKWQFVLLLLPDGPTRANVLLQRLCRKLLVANVTQDAFAVATFRRALLERICERMVHNTLLIFLLLGL